MRHHSPAHPCSLTNESEDEDRVGYEGEDLPPWVTSHYSGLTIREHFAGLAMQALIGRGETSDALDIAELAVQHANALIANLYPGDFEDDTTETTEHGPNDSDADGPELEPTESDAQATAHHPV